MAISTTRQDMRSRWSRHCFWSSNVLSLARWMDCNALLISLTIMSHDFVLLFVEVVEVVEVVVVVVDEDEDEVDCFLLPRSFLLHWVKEDYE